MARNFSAYLPETDPQDIEASVCDDCLTAAYDADTCPEKRDRIWQTDFCLRHGDILADHECAGDGCECACNA